MKKIYVSIALLIVTTGNIIAMNNNNNNAPDQTPAQYVSATGRPVELIGFDDSDDDDQTPSTHVEFQNAVAQSLARRSINGTRILISQWLKHFHDTTTADEGNFTGAITNAHANLLTLARLNGKAATPEIVHLTARITAFQNNLPHNNHQQQN